MTGLKQPDEGAQVLELDRLLRIKRSREMRQRFGWALCKLGRHDWNYPKHTATRNCLRCVTSQALGLDGEWVTI